MREFINIIERAEFEEEAEIDEAGVARVVQHIREGAPFFLMSAMRANLERSVNMDRTKKLRHILNGLPVTYINTSGKYWETGADQPSREISFFVLAYNQEGQIPIKQLHQIGVKLMQGFEQDSIIFGDGEDITLILNDGAEEKIGNHATFDPETIDSLDGFTEIKGRRFSFTKEPRKHPTDRIRPAYADEPKQAV